MPAAPLQHRPRQAAARQPDLIAYAAGLAAALLLFFHGQLANGFTLLLGDRQDAVIEAAILEHWKNVLSSISPWDTTFSFAPYRGTLGYNDGYLLFGLPYSLVRWLGADPFLASELVDVCLRAVAYAAMAWLLRRFLRLGTAWCIFGAVLFAVAGNMANQAGHAQMLAVAFAPLLAGLLWQAARAWRARRLVATLAWTATASLLIGTWLLTAFYTAWFTLFTLAIAALLAAVRYRRALLAEIGALPAGAWLTLAASGAVLLACLAPFLALYLPKAQATGMHSRAFAFYYATNPLDLIQLGPGHPGLSALDRVLQAHLRPKGPNGAEHADGFALPLLIFFAMACAELWRRRATTGPLALVTAATLLVWLATVRFGAWAAWFWIYAAVPGAKALRVLVRDQLVATATVVPVVTWFLATRRWNRALLGAIALAPVADEVTLAPPLGLDRPATLASLQAVPPPPPGCQVFAALRPAPPPDSELDAIYAHNVQAMLLAELFRRPTINGYATFTPPDWDFAHPERPDYPARIGTYAAAHHLSHLCTLDLQALHWTPEPPLE